MMGVWRGEVCGREGEGGGGGAGGRVNERVTPGVGQSGLADACHLYLNSHHNPNACPPRMVGTAAVSSCTNVCSRG